MYTLYFIISTYHYFPPTFSSAFVSLCVSEFLRAADKHLGEGLSAWAPHH